MTTRKRGIYMYSTTCKLLHEWQEYPVQLSFSKFSRLFAFVLIFGLALPGIGKAQLKVDCQSFERATENSPMTGWLAEVFRHRRNPIVGEQREFKPGIAWRLVTDASTNLALPRITQMPDREGMDKANLLLDAAHGCLLVQYAWWTGYFHSEAQSGSGSSGSANSPPGGFVWQPDPDLIELTYTGPRLVSFFEMRVYASAGAAYYITPKGMILDLERKRGYEAASCGSEEDDRQGFFRLADFLDVCTPEAKARFMEIRASRIEAIKNTIEFAQDPYDGDCGNEMGPIDTLHDISLHLTGAGLAVYDSAFLPGWPKHCLDNKSLINPVVIPYRDLEPFMKPGPWRDELLKSTGR